METSQRARSRWRRLLTFRYGIRRPSGPYRLAVHDWTCDSFIILLEHDLPFSSALFFFARALFPYCSLFLIYNFFSMSNISEEMQNMKGEWSAVQLPAEASDGLFAFDFLLAAQLPATVSDGLSSSFFFFYKSLRLFDMLYSYTQAS